MYVCCSVTDVLLDIAILCIPALFIRTLNITKGLKIGLVGIFGLGIFCIIALIARLSHAVEYVQVNIEGNYLINFTGSVVNMIIWSGIEACAHLPCSAPLLKRGPILSYISPTLRSVLPLPTYPFLPSQLAAKHLSREHDVDGKVLSVSLARDPFTTHDSHRKRTPSPEARNRAQNTHGERPTDRPWARDSRINQKRKIKVGKIDR